MEQTTKDQHYVPKFYLNKFVDAEKRMLQILDIEQGKIIKPKYPSQVCYDHYFYSLKTGEQDELGQFIEKHLKINFEDPISLVYDEILNKIINYESLTDEHIDYLSALIAMLWTRTKYMRETINYNINKISDKFNLNTNNTDNLPHLNMISEINTYKEIFKDKKWRFFIAKDDYFITSDNPVTDLINTNNSELLREKINKQFLTKSEEINFIVPKTYLNNNIILRQQLFPLSPKILIILIADYYPGKKLKRKSATDGLINVANFYKADNSLEYCFANKKEFLDKVIVFRQQVINLIVDGKIQNNL